MQAMEKNLIRMATEVEKLRVEVLSAEKKMHGNFLFLYKWYLAHTLVASFLFLPPFPSVNTCTDVVFFKPNRNGTICWWLHES